MDGKKWWRPNFRQRKDGKTQLNVIAWKFIWPSGTKHMCGNYNRCFFLSLASINKFMNRKFALPIHKWIVLTIFLVCIFHSWKFQPDSRCLHFVRDALWGEYVLIRLLFQMWHEEHIWIWHKKDHKYFYDAWMLKLMIVTISNALIIGQNKERLAEWKKNWPN